jgi:hypothetical protein
LIGKNEIKELKWLEIIEVRAVQIDKKLLNQKFDLLRDDTHPYESVKIYIKVRTGTYWIFHLLINSEQANTGGSDIVLRIKEVIKEFGIINYSIWLEQY